MSTSKSFKVHIKTYGCQMNERDSEMIAALLQRQGYVLTDRESQADIVIVNTCSVRGKAEDKAIGKLQMLIAARQEHPNRIVGVVGCMVQRMKEELFRKAPGLNFAVGTHALAKVPAILDAIVTAGTYQPNAIQPQLKQTSNIQHRTPNIEYQKEEIFHTHSMPRSKRRSILEVTASDAPYDGHTHLPSETTAFVNILFGCNRHCTYCVVPEVRGAEWSRPAREVIEEVRQLVAQGVKDVTLLGQSIMAYGLRIPVWEAEDPSPLGFTEPLPRLLEALNAIPGLRRLRFTSGHPCGCTAELARAFAELPAVCEHLHLPLQSASDRILRLMNRGYTAADYREAVRLLKKAQPRIVLTTDVIVGFPTETPEEFDLTRAFLEEIGFDNVYIFKYNPRPGTPAAQMKDDVSDREKLKRNHALLEDQGRRSQAFHRTFIGQTCEVLVEGPSLRNEARWAGRTRHNILAVFEATPGLKVGDIITIKVAEATAQALYGRIENKL